MIRILLQVLGGILTILGIITVICPQFLSERVISDDIYLSVEQRIKYGFLIGIGLLLFFRHQFSPWYMFLVALMFFLSAGFAMARLIGIVIEGVDSRQLFWLGAESLSALVFGTIYFLGSNRTS